MQSIASSQARTAYMGSEARAQTAITKVPSSTIEEEEEKGPMLYGFIDVVGRRNGNP